MPPPISIIIPALNEAESIGHVVAEMPWHLVAECIVVDNGSTDATASIATQAARGSANLAALRAHDDDNALFELTATEVLEMMEEGELTSEQYVRVLLARADQLAALNVFISRDPQAVLACL